MRNYFFEKGDQVRTPLGEFILTRNRLDTHNYILERVQNCTDNYVFDNFTFIEDDHFVRYYTCWEQEENVATKQEKEQASEIRGSRKKAMNLKDFLNRKKGEAAEPALVKHQSGLGKSKKQLQSKKEQMTKVKAVYIQLQAFKTLDIPQEIQQIKIEMAVTYLLAQAVNQTHGIWPLMVPVVASEGLIRFVKKGQTRNEQLVRLFTFMMEKRTSAEWSKQMQSVYEMYAMNRDAELLGEKIHYDLMKIIESQHPIALVEQGKKKSERARISSPQKIVLMESGYELPLRKFTVTFSYGEQNTREVSLEHQTEEPITLIGGNSDFVIKYLRTFRLR